MKTPAHNDTAQQGADASHDQDESLAQLHAAFDEIDREFGISTRLRPAGDGALPAGGSMQPDAPNQTRI